MRQKSVVKLIWVLLLFLMTEQPDVFATGKLTAVLNPVLSNISR